MADTEIKQIIQVDASNALATLKDYTNNIDRLEDKIGNLDKTSQEYNETVKELQKEQENLNKTVDNGRSNVGDYSQAFESALDKTLDGIQSIDGPVGELGGTVKNIFPVIKNINKTAISGLSGIRKGIAATGIGLLVIVIGELLTNWEQLTAAVGISKGQIDDFKNGLMGVVNVINNFVIQGIKSTIDAFKGLGQIIKDVFTGNFSEIKTHAEEAFSSIKTNAKNAFNFEQVYKEGVENAKKAVNETKKTATTVNEVVKETVDKDREAAEQIVENLRKEGLSEIELLTEKYEKEKKLLEKYGLDTDALTEKFEKDKQKILDKEGQAEYNLLKKQLDDQLNLLKSDKEQQQFLAENKDYGDAPNADFERYQEKYRIEQDYIYQRIQLQEKFLQNFKGTTEQQVALEAQLDAERQKYANNQIVYNNKVKENSIKNAEAELKARKESINGYMTATANLFGALSELSGENSEEQKAFAIMETVINTLQSIMATWAGYAKMGTRGAILAGIQTATLIATGAATVKKIKGTTKESASSGTIAAPSMPTATMTQVSPLLDEQTDLNRMTSLTQTQQTEQQPTRVYVLEEDIRNVGNKVRVTEEQSTF